MIPGNHQDVMATAKALEQVHSQNKKSKNDNKSKLDGIQDPKSKFKGVGHKRVQNLTNKMEDPLNIKSNFGQPSTRFDINYQNNIFEIDNQT